MKLIVSIAHLRYISIEMCGIQLLLTADPSLGRVDLRSLSDQTLMELLIEGSQEDSKKQYQCADGTYLDVCEWETVNCDEDERVVSVNFEDNAPSGSLQLGYLPQKVEFVDFSHNRLTGTVDFMAVPEGTEWLYLEYNRLTGSVDLIKLPKSIRELRLDFNQLRGSICVTELPEGIRKLNLRDNQFEGSIDLTQLPVGMHGLSIENNRFEGSFIAKDLPPDLKYLQADRNHFCGIAVVDSKTTADIEVRECGVASAVDENGKLSTRYVRL